MIEVSEDRVSRIEDTLGEIRGKLGGVAVSVDLLADHVAKQNGRVAKAEDWQATHTSIHARADGASEVREAWSKRDIAFMAALGLAVLGLVSDVVRTVIIHAVSAPGS